MVLSFCGCSKITNTGIGMLAEGLPACMQTFKLNLRKCTAITDEGVMLIQQNLPSNLTTLRLSLDGTCVSEQKRKSLERTEKPQSPVKEDEKRKPYKKEKQQKKKDDEAQKVKQQAEEENRLKVAEECRRRATELQSFITQDYKRKLEIASLQNAQPLGEEEEEEEDNAEEDRRLAEEEERQRRGEMQRKEEEEVKRRQQEEEERRRRHAEFEAAARRKAGKERQAPPQQESPKGEGRGRGRGRGKAKPAAAKKSNQMSAQDSWRAVKKKLAPKLEAADLEIARHTDENGNLSPFLGAYVDVAYCGSTVTGIVRFMGEVNFAPGEWLGVALEQPLSNHDGSMLGVRYFQARPSCGLFVLPSAVQGVKAPGVFSMPKLIPLIDTAVSQAMRLKREQSPNRSPGTASGPRSASSPSRWDVVKSGATSAGSSPFQSSSPKSGRGLSRSPKLSKGSRR
mmetsp:Transcript_120896/g.209877  ORF Transcript_120896/g.209877 Transcript_120896/m.209877 type:complete len:454 (-) Transcript_120896:82-1443(-)